MKKNKPDIRFVGFANAWELRKLGEIGKTQSGIGFPNIEQGGLNGTPFFKVSDMNNAGNEHEMTAANNYVSDEQMRIMNWKSIETLPAMIFAKVGAAIMLDRKRVVYTPFLIDNNMMAYIFDENWNAEFGKTLFETIYLPRYAQIGALPSYNASDIEVIDIRIPSKDEQQQIGFFFKTLDDLITLHQRELDLLKLQKKAFLQKMFPQEGQTAPEIRFEGFTEAWEQCKLGDITQRVRGNDGRMDLPTLTISAGNGWLDQRERFSSNIAGNEQKNYTLLSNGELSYNHGNSKLAKFGAVFVLRNYEEALVPRVYHSFKVTSKADPDFIEYMFATKLPDKELGKLISSGARMDGLLNINYDEFMGIKIKVPTSKEQTLISVFFRQLDQLITLHQRELDNYKELKKGFLQKMFV